MDELTKGVIYTLFAFVLLGYLYWILKDKFKAKDHHSILRYHLIDDGLSYEEASDIVSKMTLVEI